MKLTHKFAEMTPDKRPQDPHMDGAGLRFETMEYGGEYPDTMPQAIKLIDTESRNSQPGRTRSPHCGFLTQVPLGSLLYISSGTKSPKPRFGVGR
jgi:hypothetical protein